ncbi:MAG: chromate transporter [Acholeplasmataceae bacterium]|nr:chromate transporter [Acholeplasmataceae bacterium]
MKEKWNIFSTFFIIGLTTFGGGYGMLAVMQHKLVSKKNWLEAEEMLELLAISEASPGPFAINAAIFIGYKRAKFWGSFFATLGVVLPSLLISILIAILMRTAGENVIFQSALKGISSGVSVIILLAFLSLGRKSEFSIYNLIIFLISTALVFFNVISIIYIIILGAAFGIIVGFVKQLKERKNGTSN